MRFSVYLLIFSLFFSYSTSSDILTEFTVTIKALGNTSSPTQIPQKSVHVKYTLPSHDDPWNIVEFKPFIQLSNRGVQQMTVRLCDSAINIDKQDFIWYDDETNCDGVRSTLIYAWTSDLPLSPFRISDYVGFPLGKSNSIVLTITYDKEGQLRKDQSGIILYISTLMSRFQMGTIVVGNKEKGTRFSCRSSNFPRLLYGIKPLFSNKTSAWWHIYVIRNRSFGRKLVQFVFDSSKMLDQNEANIKVVAPDIFLLPEDYIIIECERVSQPNCDFLIFYTYKNIPYNSIENDHICQNDNYPSLFKLIPSRKTLQANHISTIMSNIDGRTIFLLVCMLLFVIWISIIIFCVIMRRIRGLVNFRTESATPISSNKTRPFFSEGRTAREQCHQKIAAEGEHTAQLDIEHMGLMS